VAIKLSAAAAGWYEETLAAVTGTAHRIVVDPTDLVGLLVLSVTWRALTRPQPLGPRRRAFVSCGMERSGLGQWRPWLATGLGGVAQFFTVANSVLVDSPRGRAPRPEGFGANADASWHHPMMIFEHLFAFCAGGCYGEVSG
jgi:hypothetical protein